MKLIRKLCDNYKLLKWSNMTKSGLEHSDFKMASSYPHDDAAGLGQDKSEQSYKEWERHWDAIENGSGTGFGGISLSDHGAGISTKATDKEMATNGKDSNRRWLFALRHGERVDLTYGQWTPHCFNESGVYVRKDLNMPLKLGEREGGAEAYARDSPLTRLGRFQAQLVGEGLRLAGVPVTHVYASCALRCVETAHEFLVGLQADPSVKIRVEPGLFEFILWHGKSVPTFMTALELHKAGYNVDLNYKPYMDLAESSEETMEDFVERNVRVIRSAVKDAEAEGGNVIFVGHAATVDLLVLALKHIGLSSEDAATKIDIYNHLLRVPYCGLGAMRDKPYEVVSPPCPPSINSSSGRFDWKLLLDI